MQTWVIGTVVLSAVVGSWVGLKLLRLALRTREWPELCVGIGLFSYAAVAQSLRVVTLSLPEDTAPAWLVGLVVVRMAAFTATLAGLGLFIWRVFGPDTAWRRNLAMALTAIAAVSAVFVTRGYATQLAGGEPAAAVWRVAMGLAFLVTFAWTSIDSLRYHGLMRRRLALGLADPALVNRFLVWGGGAGLSVALTLVPVLSSLAGRVDDPVAGIATAAAGVLNALVWSLTFTPPASYVAWLRARHAGGASSA